MGWLDSMSTLEVENSVTFVRKEVVIRIAPRDDATIKALPRLNVRPGRLRENAVITPGVDGAKKVVLGYEDAEIDLTVQIWDESQLSKLEKLIEFFRPKIKSNTFEPFKIFSRATERWGITFVYITEINEHSWDPRTGLVLEVALREWQPPNKNQTNPPRVISSNGAVGGGNQSKSKPSEKPLPKP